MVALRCLEIWKLDGFDCFCLYVSFRLRKNKSETCVVNVIIAVGVNETFIINICKIYLLCMWNCMHNSIRVSVLRNKNTYIPKRSSTVNGNSLQLQRVEHRLETLCLLKRVSNYHSLILIRNTRNLTYPLKWTWLKVYNCGIDKVIPSSACHSLQHVFQW